MIAYTCKTEATVFFSLLGFKATRAAFSSLPAHKFAELPHHSQIDFLYLLDVRLLLAKAQKEIEAIPIPANGLRGILPNLNLN